MSQIAESTGEPEADTPEGGEESLLSQLKPLILFCACTLVVLIIGVYFAAQGLMGSFGRVEDADVTQKSVQVYRGFEADLRQLAISNRDYAEWDDAEQYIRGHDMDFIERNFSAETVTSMNVDVVWIVDPDGRTLFSTLVDSDTKTAVSPAPAALLEQFRTFQTTDRKWRNLTPAQRITGTSQGVAGVSAIEISRSDHSRPTGAVMLFARFIRKDEMARLREATELPVELAFATGPAAHPEALPAEVRAWMSRVSGKQNAMVRSIDGANIEGYTLVRSIDGAPALIFRTPLHRDIRALASRTTWYLLSGMVLTFIAFGTTVFGLVVRLMKLFARHIEQRQRAREVDRANRRNLAHQAQHDALTGLPNRNYLNVRMPKLLSRIANSRRVMALICLDIDHFKNINDSRGHSTGDELLKVVAQRLRASVSAHDLVARMGGDEFVIIASLLPDMKAVERLAQRLQAALASEIVIWGSPVRITASMGIVVHPQDGNDLESLLKRADIALYQAKEDGRRCHRYFAAEMDAAINEHAALEQSLRHALEARQLFMDYQPIVDLHDGKLVSLEALMRWRHPQMGLIPPGRFIPVAERSGLIVELGEYALKEVMAQQRTWLDAGVPIVPIAVNVSALQIERTEFAAVAKRLAADAGIDLKWIRFEVTESAVMKQPERLINTLQALREQGSQILIDDFGTGYSSLSYLNRLPVDILKIDRAFVRELDAQTDQVPIIHAVLDMARKLHLKTVAEGVETREQSQVLSQKGCDCAQGFYYSKPVSADHCREVLEQLQNSARLTNSTVLRVLKTA